MSALLSVLEPPPLTGTPARGLRIENARVDVFMCRSTSSLKKNMSGPLEKQCELRNIRLWPLVTHVPIIINIPREARETLRWKIHNIFRRQAENGALRLVYCRMTPSKFPLHVVNSRLCC